ncbi:septation protein SepH [Rhodoluna sp. KAS3]|uniref:septation protein SepH n=1 Tax=Rhodoluna sp. KAS3 TaxID=942880 RepID=UPI00222FBD37|nr:septation protein SepH [Rhodoluna sp. KAS3]BDS49087.1 DNA-binding protein [Rhodoluna sp. KAS3]
MDDIRFIEAEGDFLVLESTDGQRFRLLADDQIRSALRREAAPKLDAVKMTPREIQDAVRDGEDIASLVERSGATFDFVEKFAAPVIAELAHIIDSALTVRLGIVVDRDHTTVEFGEMISARIHNLGAATINWKAKRSDLGIWHLAAEYELPNGSSTAVWSFDPKRLALSPENENAINLTNNEAQKSSSAPAAFANPILKIVDQPTSEVTEVLTATPVENVASLPAVESRASAADVVPELAAGKTKRPAMPAPAEPLSATADLLEALRRKRTERTETQETAAIQEPAVMEVADESAETQSISEGEAAPVKKGRASMPSWDEIVFGTKTDD